MEGKTQQIGYLHVLLYN